MAKPNGLVLEHLERVSRTALEKHQTIIRDYVRRRHGIYALYRDDKLYYIGLASSLGGRLKQHLRDRHSNSWNYFSVYITSKSDHMRELEALALRIVKPKGNKQSGRLAHSQNLRRHFEAAIKQKYDEERANLFMSPARQRRARPSGDRDGQLRGKRSSVSGLFDTARALRAWHEGYEYSAKLLTNGGIKYENTEFNSPSHAARQIVVRNRNGLTFWHCKNHAGEWTPLKSFMR